MGRANNQKIWRAELYRNSMQHGIDDQNFEFIRFRAHFLGTFQIYIVLHYKRFLKIFSKIALMQIRANLHHGEPTVEGHFNDEGKCTSLTTRKIPVQRSTGSGG